MADCPNTRTCPFFNDQMAGKPATANLLKRSFCSSQYVDCARYIVCIALGGPKVPSDLYPNMKSRALTMLGSS